MKIVVRALVLSVAVSGAAASVFSAHSAKAQAMVVSHQAMIVNHQAAVANVPMTLCIPTCAGW
jgi:hypothetical protein